MNIDDYLEYSIKNKLLYDLSWFQSMIGIHTDIFKNKYIDTNDTVGFFIVDDEKIAIDNYKPKESIIKLKTIIKISKDTLLSIDDDVTTEFGKFIVNYFMVEYPFKGVLKYVTGDVSASTIVDIVKDYLSEDKITADDYKLFVWSCTYLESLSRLVTPSSTYKLVTPPKNIDSFKTKLRNEMIGKYGDSWSDDPSNIVEYDTKLKGYYSDYIKDDPSNGVLADGKAKDNALAKKYLTFSSTNAFGESEHIDSSLLDGYPEDPKKLAAMYNTIRSASYSRGAETQKGGAVAKDVLRATASIRIDQDDCKVKYGKSYKLDKNNSKSLLGRYIISNSNVIKLTMDNISDYIDATIIVRSPMYCKSTHPSLCKICVGEKGSGYENGVPLIVTNISSVLTTSALKAMHNTQISTARLNLDNMVF